MSLSMAEETQKPEASAAAPEAETTPALAEEVAVEKPITEKEAPAPAPVPEPEKPEVEEVIAEVGKDKEKDKEKEKERHEEQEKIAQSASFKEESNVVGELPDPQKKALDELKQLIQDALNKHEFVHEPKPAAEEKKEEEKEKEKVPPEPKEEKPSSSSVEESKAEEEKEQPKAEETKPEEPKPEAEPESKKHDEEAKTEEKLPVAETKEEENIPPPPPAATESVVVTEVVEKTVEAIEETIVAAKTEAPDEPAPAAEKAEVVAPADVPPPSPEEVSIWGIPLFIDERSDTIFLKFLRARDFKVKDAFTMIKNTVRWRKEFGIDALLEEDLGNDLEKVVFMHGFDKEGHPVCYNVFGEFQNKELYQNAFADDEKRTKFLRWRIQFLEKSIRKLDFSPSGICTIVQVSDLKNSPGPAKRELRLATNQALQLLQDNYPEFVAKQVFINVPWWYLAFNRMISPFLTQRTKSKFVFAGPSKSAETLFKYIAPEQVPVQYGGLSRGGDQEFTSADPVTEVTIKPAAKHTVEFPVSEISVLAWELRVLGWDVSYGAEFIPSAEGSYTVIVSKTRKVAPADEPVISDTFKIGEPGKVVLTIDNQSSKKKKLLYRSKTKPSSF